MENVYYIIDSIGYTQQGNIWKVRFSCFLEKMRVIVWKLFKDTNYILQLPMNYTNEGETCKKVLQNSRISPNF